MVSGGKGRESEGANLDSPHSCPHTPTPRALDLPEQDNSPCILQRLLRKPGPGSFLLWVHGTWLSHREEDTGVHGEPARHMCSPCTVPSDICAEKDGAGGRREGQGTTLKRMTESLRRGQNRLDPTSPRWPMMRGGASSYPHCDASAAE